MAKMTLQQKRKELEKVAKQIEELEKEVASKIGKWVIDNTAFDNLKDFREHYEMLQKFYDEKHNLDNSGAVQNNQMLMVNCRLILVHKLRFETVDQQNDEVRYYYES